MLTSLISFEKNSMSSWDVSMQIDCSKTFQNEELLDTLSLPNRQNLLIQVLEILNQTNLGLY